MPARRKSEGPSLVRTIRFTDDEWKTVVKLAAVADMKPATYIRTVSLQRAYRS